MKMNAMPMGPGKAREFRDRLSARREVLLQEIGAALQAIGKGTAQDFTSQVQDMSDTSLAAMLTDMNLADMHRDIQELLDLDAALARIRAGTFGTCTDCGDVIPMLRLNAYPTAKRCRPCQEAHEKWRDAAHQKSSIS
jgi:RNA polymerase-binding protein DksA